MRPAGTSHSLKLLMQSTVRAVYVGFQLTLFMLLRSFFHLPRSAAPLNLPVLCRDTCRLPRTAVLLKQAIAPPLHPPHPSASSSALKIPRTRAAGVLQPPERHHDLHPCATTPPQIQPGWRGDGQADGPSPICSGTRYTGLMEQPDPKQLETPLGVSDSADTTQNKHRLVSRGS